MANKVQIIIFAKDLASRVFKKLQKESITLAKVMKGASSAIKGTFRAVRNLGIAGVAAMVGLVKSANDFRKVMAEVSTITSSGNVSNLTADVIDLSAELGVAKNELAKGLYQTLSAGIPEENAIEFLTKATKAAIGGVTNTETAVTALTKVLDSYSLSARDVDFVSDRMFTTVKNGVVTFEQLASGIGQVSGIASTAGVSFDELMGIFATASKTINPEELFTALRQTILAVVAPGSELTKVFKDMGVTGQELVSNKGLSGALDTIQKKTGGSLAKMKQLIPNIRALPAILAVTGTNASKSAKNIDAMSKAAGASAEAFERMDIVRGWARLWQQILRPITKLGIVFDKQLSPGADKIGKAIAKWQSSESFTNFLTNVKDTMVQIQGIIEGLLAGGGAQTAAITKLKNVGTSIATTIGTYLSIHGPAIGEKIGIGIVKGVAKAPIGVSKKAIQGAGRQSAHLQSLQGEGANIGRIEKISPLLANLLTGGDSAAKITVSEQIRSAQQAVQLETARAAARQASGGMGTLIKATEGTTKAVESLKDKGV